MSSGLTVECLLPDGAEGVIEHLRGLFDANGAAICRIEPLTGGASKEIWGIDIVVDGAVREFVLRRDIGPAVYSDMLSLEDEYAMLQVAYDAGVKVPRPAAFFAPVDDVPSGFLMERVHGETFGNRIAKRNYSEADRTSLIDQIATELASIHAIPVDALRFLPGLRRPTLAPPYLDRLEHEINRLEDGHPAIELGLRWLRENPPRSHGISVVHGDFRVGNLAIDDRSLVAVLDWEAAHLGDPVEDLGWCIMQAWRFGADGRRVGGIGDVDQFVARYNAASSRNVSLRDLQVWELAGNVRWAIGSLAQGRRELPGRPRRVDLAVTARLAAEVELEILRRLEDLA